MKYLIKISWTVIAIWGVALHLHGQKPSLTTTQVSLNQINQKTCIERTQQAFADYRIQTNLNDGVHINGENADFTIHVSCLNCGSNVQANIAVASHKSAQETRTLQDKVLAYIKEGKPGKGTEFVDGEFKIWLDKTTFNPEEKIQVHFKAPGSIPSNAWIGILPSHIEHGSEATNDQHDLSYQYLNKRTGGTLTFTAPATRGTYDFRMHDRDDNGKEVAWVTFTVGENPGSSSAEATLRIDKTTFKPGESIQVHFTAPSSYASNAWIGIVPSDIEHGSEAKNDQHDISYQYINKQTSGTMKFVAPIKPGRYDFRLHDTDSNGKEITHVGFVVQ